MKKIIFILTLGLIQFYLFSNLFAVENGINIEPIKTVTIQTTLIFTLDTEIVIFEKDGLNRKLIFEVSRVGVTPEYLMIKNENSRNINSIKLKVKYLTAEGEILNSPILICDEYESFELSAKSKPMMDYPEIKTSFTIEGIFRYIDYPSLKNKGKIVFYIRLTTWI